MPCLPDPNLTTSGVLAALHDSGCPLREWGRAIDGTPMLAAQVGGSRQPAVFLTAGAHSSETAGVHACLALLESLETDHEVHILPLRDPVGFAGVDRCLSLASGDDVHMDDPNASLDFLQDRAELLWSEADLHLFLLGDLGFVWAPPLPGLDTFWRQFNLTSRLPREVPDAIRPLHGKTVFLINANSTIEGSGALQRCYHTVLDADGQWLHLNRFFGLDDAPPEVAAVDKLIQTIRPGLTVDLHEGNGEGFWLPIPRPRQHEELVLEMSRAFFSHIQERSYPIEGYEHWRQTHGIDDRTPDYMQPEPRQPGHFWLHQEEQDEGPNLMTYAARVGIGYGTEAPMELPLAVRVDGLTDGIRRAMAVWEGASLPAQKPQ